MKTFACSLFLDSRSMCLHMCVYAIDTKIIGIQR